MKCKAQWNVAPSWHKGKNLSQESWSSHRKTAFIGTRPDINSTELGTAFKALLSLASNMSPSEQAERVHYHFLNVRRKQSSNIILTATRRKKFLFSDTTYVRYRWWYAQREEKCPSCRLFTCTTLVSLKHSLILLTPSSHLHPMDVIQLSFCEVTSTSLQTQTPWELD